MRFRGSAVHRFAGSLALALLSLLIASRALAQSGPGVVGEVRVHGNHTTPDADILGIVGDVVGKPATDALMAEVEKKLERSGRFDGVEVRKRFRSIENPDDILLMIVVDEVPGIDPLDLEPSPMKKFWSSGMFMPILHSEDGYGFTYGARVSFVDRFGPRSRITVPLTWGGERQARVQLERSFKSGPIDRIGGEYGITQRDNPHYEIADQRVTAGARIDAAPTRWLRLGAGGRRDNVQFGHLEDTVSRFGGDITLDTRVDPAFPRNAIHATFGIDRVTFDDGHANQKKADVRGYVGLFRQLVLAVRGLSITTDTPLPIYEHNLLGGAANLRGYEAGYQAGDNLAAASAELRIPITSPLTVGRFGVKAFVDWGATYGVGEKLSDQTFDRGIGAGAYLHLTAVSVSLDVARSQAGNTRYHFGLGVTFNNK
ncbi:MAG TPA: BamA/TamA family outer membrane protein [Vicinamibacterales bacterium]|nr:BamA/TamA family outer membrane protein [Vicinamibacterales bacterium]